MASRMDWWEVLDVLAWGFSKLACPTLRGILDGYQEQPAPPPGPRVWRRLESQQWIQREGKGPHMVIRITPAGLAQCVEPDPLPHWNRRWDGRWRLVTFDVPVEQRKDRQALWPGGYQGEAVVAAHKKLRAELGARLKVLASKE